MVAGRGCGFKVGEDGMESVEREMVVLETGENSWQWDRMLMWRSYL